MMCLINDTDGKSMSTSNELMSCRFIQSINSKVSNLPDSEVAFQFKKMYYITLFSIEEKQTFLNVLYRTNFLFTHSCKIGGVTWHLHVTL